MSIELVDKRIMVTGGAGFLGSYLVGQLKEKGCQNIFVPTIEKYDLTKREAIAQSFIDAKPEIVIHLAAKVGGIGANQDNPGSYFYDNLIMGIQLIEEARERNIEKFVSLGTICCYPKFATVPFQEKNIWDGYPEETNAPYGLAKKMLLVQGQAYRQQYGFNSIFLMPVNLYGPRDNFDSKSSHVIPALIKKFIEAIALGQSEVSVWGTGKPTREFLYAGDCAKAIVLATENYNGKDPVNIGSGAEITIKDLALMIAEYTGFTGNIVWDSSKPDGQPRRKLDVTRASKLFGFKAATSFEVGLKKTIDFYKNHELIRGSEKTKQTVH